MSFKFKYRKYAETLYSALYEDAFYITMEESIESGESSKEAMLRYMEFSMIEGEKSGELYIPEDNEYGVSVWTKPINRELETKKHHEKKLFLLNQMGDKCLKTYNAIVDFMSVNAEPFIGKDFWYLSIVGCSPRVPGTRAWIRTHRKYIKKDRYPEGVDISQNFYSTKYDFL